MPWRYYATICEAYCIVCGISSLVFHDFRLLSSVIIISIRFLVFCAHNTYIGIGFIVERKWRSFGACWCGSALNTCWSSFQGRQLSRTTLEPENLSYTIIGIAFDMMDFIFLEEFLLFSVSGSFFCWKKKNSQKLENYAVLMRTFESCFIAPRAVISILKVCQTNCLMQVAYNASRS